ncbi:MAG: GPW/gp25 family protein [Pseudomonadota bacterium]
MTGIDAGTGAALSGVAHLAQSVADILTTPRGTRVGVRDYGSDLFELQDQPMNGLGRLRVFAATATALARWEPRLKLTRVTLETAGADGAFALRIDGVSTDDSAPGPVNLFTPLRLTV